MVNSWLKPGLEEKMSQPSLEVSLAFPDWTSLFPPLPPSYY